MRVGASSQAILNLIGPTTARAVVTIAHFDASDAPGAFVVVVAASLLTRRETARMLGNRAALHTAWVLGAGLSAGASTAASAGTLVLAGNRRGRRDGDGVSIAAPSQAILYLIWPTATRAPPAVVHVDASDVPGAFVVVVLASLLALRETARVLGNRATLHATWVMVTGRSASASTLTSTSALLLTV